MLCSCSFIVSVYVFVVVALTFSASFSSACFLSFPFFSYFSNINMGLYSPSPTGDAKEIEMANHDMTLAMWEKRLFGKDSYTNITIPPLGN